MGTQCMPKLSIIREKQGHPIFKSSQLNVGGQESFRDPSFQEAEKHLSEMVVSKAIMVAKIDRPVGSVCFQPAQDRNDILNSWASNLEKLLDLVEKSCPQIHKETMVHKAAIKA